MPLPSSATRPGPRSCRWRAAAALVVGVALPCGASPTGSAAPVRAAVEVVPFEGAGVRGALVGVTADGVNLDGREAPIALDGVREVRFSTTAAGSAPPSAPTDGTPLLRAVLRGDEIVRGRLVRADDLGVEIAPPGLEPVRLVFDVLRRLEADGPGRDPCAEPGREHPPREGSDVAYTRAGDAFAGTLEGATAEGVVIDGDGTKRTVRWADLEVLHVDEPALPAATGRVAELETRGGSRLPSTSAVCDGSAWTLRTRSGLDVKVPVAATDVVRFAGGRFVHASALPFTAEFTPYYADDVVDASYLKVWFGARVDRTSKGCPLTVAGTTYRHGIAVHAKSAVRLPLGRRFVRFHGRVGIDDEALEAKDGPRGDVTARVLADGREVWSSGGSVKGGEPARAVGPLDVTGVDTLTLEVDFGGGRHVMDRADWVDLVLELPR